MMIPQVKKTRNIVRERMGLPDSSALLHDLTPMQLLALQLVELDEAMEGILENGCQRGRDNGDRIASLEENKTRTQAWIKGAYAAAGMLAATALFIFACVEFMQAVR